MNNIKSWFSSAFNLGGSKNAQAVLEAKSKNRDVLEKIKVLAQQGQQIGFVIGRRADQSLPGQKPLVDASCPGFDDQPFPVDEEKDKTITWITIDREGSEGLDKSSLHLNMDFQLANEIVEIQNIAQKVICDVSVTKFMNFDYLSAMTGLLKKGSGSELIVQTNTSVALLDVNLKNYRQMVVGYSSVRIPLNTISHEEINDAAVEYVMQTAPDVYESEFQEWKKCDMYDGTDEQLRNCFLAAKGREICEKKQEIDGLSPDQYAQRQFLKGQLDKNFQQVEIIKKNGVGFFQAKGRK